MSDKIKYYIRAKKKDGIGYGFLKKGDWASPWTFETYSKSTFDTYEDACRAAGGCEHNLIKLSSELYNLEEAEIVKEVTSKYIEKKIRIVTM